MSLDTNNDVDTNCDITLTPLYHDEPLLKSIDINKNNNYDKNNSNNNNTTTKKNEFTVNLDVNND